MHLAGVGLGDRPWTPAHKRAVLDSRVEGTTTIAARHGRAEPRADAARLASGVGYYGNPGDTVLDEDSPRGTTYLADIAAAWEAATAAAAAAGVRVVPAAHRGRALGQGRRLGPAAAAVPARPRRPARLRAGSGGPGSRWTTTSRAVRFLLDHDDLAGPVNLTAPEPLTNAEMTAAMGRVLHRPTLLHGARAGR